MGLQLFKISPCALRLFIVHVSKAKAAIPRFWEICSDFPDMQFPCTVVPVVCPYPVVFSWSRAIHWICIAVIHRIFVCAYIHPCDNVLGCSANSSTCV